MYTGKYYFDFLPEVIQEEFMKNTGTQFGTVMLKEYASLEDLIDDSFSAMYSVQGTHYWALVSINFAPSAVTKSSSFIDKNAKSILIFAVSILAGAIVMVFLMGERAEQDKKMWKKEIELINNKNK